MMENERKWIILSGSVPIERTTFIWAMSNRCFWMLLRDCAWAIYLRQYLELLHTVHSSIVAVWNGFCQMDLQQLSDDDGRVINAAVVVVKYSVTIRKTDWLNHTSQNGVLHLQYWGNIAYKHDKNNHVVISSITLTICTIGNWLDYHICLCHKVHK